MINRSLTELATALRAKEISSVELTLLFLDRIARYGDLNAFITVDEETALDQAKAADERLAKKEATPLTGIPIAHKDIFCTRDMLTTCGSKMLSNFVAPYNATIVANLANAGTVTLGKTNMDEFAMGSSNETSHFGPVKNPWNTETVPGGSSGGSAAAVAARLTPVATGSDTGGSIRQPAAFCGVTGLKPSYGRVSRYGMIAFASSLDQAGPITRSAEDAALMLQTMASFDQRDSTSVDRVVPNYLDEFHKDPSEITLGIPKQYFGDGVDKDVTKAVESAIKVLTKMGADTVEVDLPNSDLGIPCYYVIAPAEASSNLSRFDGVRYGYRASEYDDLADMYAKTRSEGFGEEVKRRIMIGTYALSSGYYDAYYNKALKLRRMIVNDFNEAFEHCDLIVGPTTPTTAFKLGDKTDDPVSMYLNDIYTASINLAGLPAISVPVGFDKGGLPIGMQLVGPYMDAGDILNVAHRFQRETDWHTRMPDGFEKVV